MNRALPETRLLALALALLPLLCACTVPGGGTPPPRYFLLEVPAGMPPLDGALPRELAVGPVTVAEYLDQPRIVIRADGSELIRRDGARWAMPLGANLSAALRGALEQLLPGTRTVSYPAAQPAALSARVAVEVLRLDGSPGGTATLVAAWRVLGRDGATLAWPEARTVLVEPVAGSDTAALVAAQAVLVGRLARRIAETLLALPR